MRRLRNLLLLACSAFLLVLPTPQASAQVGEEVVGVITGTTETPDAPPVDEHVTHDGNFGTLAITVVATRGDRTVVGTVSNEDPLTYSARETLLAGDGELDPVEFRNRVNDTVETHVGEDPSFACMEISLESGSFDRVGTTAIADVEAELHTWRVAADTDCHNEPIPASATRQRVCGPAVVQAVPNPANLAETFVVGTAALRDC